MSELRFDREEIVHGYRNQEHPTPSQEQEDRDGKDDCGQVPSPQESRPKKAQVVSTVLFDRRAPRSHLIAHAVLCAQLGFVEVSACPPPRPLLTAEKWSLAQCVRATTD